MSKQEELIRKAAQPVRAFTNANATGMIQTYMRVVEQIMHDKAVAAAKEKRSA